MHATQRLAAPTPVFTAAGLADHLPTLAVAWEQSQQDYDPQHPAFAAQQLASTCQWLGFDATMTAVLVEAGQAIRDDAHLNRLAWHMDWLLGHADDDVFPRADWPMPAEHLGQAGRLFHAVVFLAAMRHARAHHQQQCIDESISRDTLEDLGLHITHYRDRHHHWGFDATWWLAGHVRGLIYRLGRLHLAMDRLQVDYHVLRHRTDGRMCVMAGDGMMFRADGQLADADGKQPGNDAWQATFKVDQQTIRGHLITSGRGVGGPPVALPADQWEVVAQREDPILEVHIPATGPLTPEACAASLDQAMSFFPAHFPEHRFVALTCNSWLMDPQLADHLPADANIVRFQKWFEPLPWPQASDYQTLERVFPDRLPRDIDRQNLAALPRDTRLQQLIIDRMQAGHVWRSAGGIVLPAMLPDRRKTLLLQENTR